MRFVPLLILCAWSFTASGQTIADTVSLQQALDSALARQAKNADTADLIVINDSVYANAQYTQAPRDLTVTRQESEKTYRKESFDKDEWKKVVGETAYEEKTQAPKKKTSLPNFSLDPLVLKVIGYTVILGLLGYLIYLFIKQAIRDPNRKVQQISQFFTDQTNPEHVADLDLENLLREALAQNNLRLAVRLYYIKLLKHLNHEGFIRWEKNKTNRDYANELVSVGFSGQFKKLMIAYEYVWYGERTPSTEEFKTLEVTFKKLYETQQS